MATTASKRIQKELIELQKRELQGVTIAPVSDDNLLEWKGTILGPQSTPYKGGKFKMQLTFPQNYPFNPPNFKFITPIYHPNVDDQGAICLSLLKEGEWKPSTRIVAILEGIMGLLINPNPDDPLVASIAETYQNNRGFVTALLRSGADGRKLFDKTAKEYVKKYAM